MASRLGLTGPFVGLEPLVLPLLMAILYRPEGEMVQNEDESCQFQEDYEHSTRVALARARAILGACK